MKRFLSLFFALCMTLSLVPSSALADAETAGLPQEDSIEEVMETYDKPIILNLDYAIAEFNAEKSKDPEYTATYALVGNETLTADCTIPAGMTVTVDNGYTIEVTYDTQLETKPPVTLTVNGNLQLNTPSTLQIFGENLIVGNGGSVSFAEGAMLGVVQENCSIVVEEGGSIEAAAGAQISFGAGGANTVTNNGTFAVDENALCSCRDTFTLTGIDRSEFDYYKIRNETMTPDEMKAFFTNTSEYNRVDIIFNRDLTLDADKYYVPAECGISFSKYYDSASGTMKTPVLTVPEGCTILLEGGSFGTSDVTVKNSGKIAVFEGSGVPDVGGKVLDLTGGANSEANLLAMIDLMLEQIVLKSDIALTKPSDYTGSVYDVNLSDETNLLIPEGLTLTVGTGVTLNVYGTVTVEGGQLDNCGTADVSGKITGSTGGVCNKTDATFNFRSGARYELQDFENDGGTITGTDKIVREMKLSADPTHYGENTYRINTGEISFTIDAVVYPVPFVTEAEKTVKWTIADTDVATVADGTVTRKFGGTTTITAAATGLNKDTAVNASFTKNLTVQNSLTLPEQLKTIDDGAFTGTYIYDIVLQDGVTAIGSKAFKDCTSLKLIVIPDTVTSIASDAFSGCSDVTILCSEGSTAADYAADNGMKYAYFGD